MDSRKVILIHLLNIVLLEDRSVTLPERDVSGLHPCLDQVLGQLLTLGLLRVLQTRHNDLLERGPSIAAKIGSTYAIVQMKK